MRDCRACADLQICMHVLCFSLAGVGSCHLRLSIQHWCKVGSGHRHTSRRATKMNDSARVAVARQWTVDGLRTKWSALAHNATLAGPIHALTVAGMSIAAAMLTLRAARLFVRFVTLPGPITPCAKRLHPSCRT